MPLPSNGQTGLIDQDRYICRCDTGERHQDKHLAFGLKDISGRLPCRAMGRPAAELEELAVKPLGPF
jgi:hypothetical protein